MAIDLDLIDKLLADYKKPEDIIGENGLLKQLTKALLERAMQAEMTDHLGYAKHDQAGNNSGNSRNGKTTKALKGDFGELPLETPRDRNGTFEPKIVAKGQTRFTGFLPPRPSRLPAHPARLAGSAPASHPGRFEKSPSNPPLPSRYAASGSWFVPPTPCLGAFLTSREQHDPNLF